MPSTGLLTTDDLDEIGCSSFDVDQPLQVAAELVDAVDQELVADQADKGYALTLAAEITEREGDLLAAVALAERAIEAYRTHGDLDCGHPQAFYAGLLLRLGRMDEAMAELTALRPLLSEDAEAASYISEALAAGGRAEIAEQWLTEALVGMLQRLPALDSEQEQAAHERAMVVACALAIERHEVRHNLGLPHDEHDRLADLLTDVVHHVFGADEQDYEGTALLFWPQPEFDQVLLRWPALAEEYGHTWDEYRIIVQQSLVRWSESGCPQLALLAGAADELASYAELNDGDPTDPQVRQGYAQHLEEHHQKIAWPPSRNHECWCGSALKYKKCCLPRART
ncbi:MAG: SEC-C metal-binding domain-containing protein [Pseudonocardiaceae bacterium]